MLQFTALSGASKSERHTAAAGAIALLVWLDGLDGTCAMGIRPHFLGYEASFFLSCGGSWGVSEVSTKTPFCYDCIITHEHAQLT